MVRRGLLVVGAISIAALSAATAETKILIATTGPMTGAHAWPGERTFCSHASIPAAAVRAPNTADRDRAAAQPTVAASPLNEGRLAFAICNRRLRYDHL